MRIAFLYLLVLFCSVSIPAQTKPSGGDWENKPIDQWSEADVKFILGNSAWGRTLEGRFADQSRLGTIAQNGFARFSLRSALTIRLALIRNLQLTEKYDTMSPQNKAAFNAKYKAVLDCVLCEKFYIVAVTGDSRILQSAMIINRRSDSIYLSNEKGLRRNLAKYSPQTTPGSESLFFFPRFDEAGKPLVDADNITVTFNLRPELGDDPIVRVLNRVDIKVEDIVRGKVVIF